MNKIEIARVVQQLYLSPAVEVEVFSNNELIRPQSLALFLILKKFAHIMAENLRIAIVGAGKF